MSTQSTEIELACSCGARFNIKTMYATDAERIASQWSDVHAVCRENATPRLIELPGYNSPATYPTYPWIVTSNTDTPESAVV